MSPAVAFLAANLIGAAFGSAYIAATNRRSWLIATPFIGLLIIWGIGYALTAT